MFSLDCRVLRTVSLIWTFSICGPKWPKKVRLKVRANSRVKVPIGQKTGLSVAEGNCVVERRGEGQPEANDQSVIRTRTRFGQDALASLPFVATEGAVGASQVAWFPGQVEGAVGGGNVLGELRAGGGVHGCGGREAL